MPRLAGLAARIKVLDFMREQFGTGLVQQLHGQALFRLRRYVETVQRNQEREQA